MILFFILKIHISTFTICNNYIYPTKLLQIMDLNFFHVHHHFSLPLPFFYTLIVYPFAKRELLWKSRIWFKLLEITTINSLRYSLLAFMLSTHLLVFIFLYTHTHKARRSFKANGIECVLSLFYLLSCSSILCLLYNKMHDN